jgi:hypothetical protein
LTFLPEIGILLIEREVIQMEKSRKGYLVVQQSKTYVEIRLQNGKVIKEYLTQSEVRGIIKTEKVIGIRRVV